MIDRLQSLFNRLAGVSDHAALCPAGNGPGYEPLSFSALEKPACWRRRTRKLARIPAHRLGKTGH